MSNLNKTKFYFTDSNSPNPNKPNHIGVACLIENENRELLLEYRQDSDYWALIGRGLEIDESLVDCVQREVLEETGLICSDIQFYDIYSDPSRIAEYPDGNVLRVITVSYKVKVIPNQLKISSESRELKFFSPKEIKNLEIARTHFEILDSYLK